MIKIDCDSCIDMEMIEFMIYWWYNCIMSTVPKLTYASKNELKKRWGKVLSRKRKACHLSCWDQNSKNRMIFSPRWINKIWTTSKSSSNWRRIVRNTNVLEVPSVMVLRQLNNRMNRSLRGINCTKNIDVRKRFLKNSHISRIQKELLKRIKGFIFCCLNKFRKIMIHLKMKNPDLTQIKNSLFHHHITEWWQVNLWKRLIQEKTRCISLCHTRMPKKECHQLKDILVKQSQQISTVKKVCSFNFWKNI